MHVCRQFNLRGVGEFVPPAKPAIRNICLIILVAIGYFIAARLSLFLAFENSNASPVWPPTGLALTAVLLLGFRVTPGIFAGAFLANIFVLSGLHFTVFESSVVSAYTALGNTLEAAVGAILIRRFVKGSDLFEDIFNVSIFLIFGAFISTLISAVFGVSSFCLRTGQWDLFGRLGLTWWLGDAAGAIVVVPIFYGIMRARASRWKNIRIPESIAALAVLIIVCFFVFFVDGQLRYFVLPVILWIILRFGLFEVTLSIAVLSCLAIIGTARSTGSLSPHASANAFLHLQSFIAIIAVTALFLTTLVRKRLQTEEDLRTEKVFSDTIIDSVPGIFFVLDDGGYLVRWNHSLEEMNLLSKDDLDGMDSLRNIHEDDRQLIRDKINEAFTAGHSEMEGRIRTKDGIRHFAFTGRKVDIHGTSYVIGSGIDVTARKIAELQLLEHQQDLEKTIEKRTSQIVEVNEALANEIRQYELMERILAESERNYRDLVEGANSIILRWTKYGKVTFINKYAQNFFGFSQDEILGQNIIGTIVPPSESTGRDLSTLAQDVYSSPDEFTINENENIRKNGERVWISWSNKPITDDDGNITEVLSVGNDITSRRNAELKLTHTLEELAVAKERAEESDRLKSAFLATMSHELRTPLNSIIGFTGIILQGYVGPLNEEQAKQLGMVRNSANHLLSLINDVLDISKIEAGQLQVSNERVDLVNVIEQCIQSVRPAAEKKNLLLITDIDPNLDSITSDRRRVEQILLNLLSNAIKFTEQGEVRVKAEIFDDESVKISVRDTGIGIKDEDMDRIFKPFQQVDSGTTRKYEGTGLGLYICLRLLEKLGGHMGVTSIFDEGTTFYFTLPFTGSTQ
jgi:PAS domain S-box-containing protein